MNLSLLRPARSFARLIGYALLLLIGGATLKNGCAHPNDFNNYVLAAVHTLEKHYGGKGYGIGVFTHDLHFGDNGVFKATSPPYTMCVAAQLEVIIEALDLYYKRHDATDAFHFIPRIYWTRSRPRDFRGEIWIVKNSPSHGAADAFANFGMGERIPFRELDPGDFLNFNRTNKTGHAVVFLGFIDRKGQLLPEYDATTVAGFKYFSSQGKDHPDGGLGYRWAFFSDVGCPTIGGDKKRDCGVLRTEIDNYLVAGFLRSPTAWDQKKAADYILEGNEIQNPALLQEGTFDSQYFTGRTTDD
jgi:hypothetical protein